MIRVLRGILLAIAVLASAASGTYLIVYLSRWEWQRAQISGLILVVAVVGLATTVVLGKLDALGRRADLRAPGPRDDERQPREATAPGQSWPPAGGAPSPDEWAAQVLRVQGEERASRHFAWLGDLPWRTGVFVPILMGAGALLSALAYGIERLAGAVATRALDPAAVRLLAPDLPLGPVPAPSVPPRSHRGRTGLAVAMLVGLLTLGIVVLAALIVTREEPSGRGGGTEVTLRIEQVREQDDPSVVAAALWQACRMQLPRDAHLVEVATVGPGSARLTLDVGMATFTRRRFVGCLQDARIDLVRAEVTDLRTWLAEDPALVGMAVSHAASDVLTDG